MVGRRYVRCPNGCSYIEPCLDTQCPGCGMEKPAGQKCSTADCRFSNEDVFKEHQRRQRCIKIRLQRMENELRQLLREEEGAPEVGAPEVKRRHKSGWSSTGRSTHSDARHAAAHHARRKDDLIMRAGRASGLDSGSLLPTENPCSCCKECGVQACFLERCHPCATICVLREGHKGFHWCRNHVEWWKRAVNWCADALGRGPGGRRPMWQTPWVFNEECAFPSEVDYDA